MMDSRTAVRPRIVPARAREMQHFQDVAAQLGNVDNLTITQLKKIYVSCTDTNWSQVGGSNVAIDPYAAQGNSGTGVTFASIRP